MNILVCIKQVPGTTQVEVDPETGVLKRDGVLSKLNPYDLFALELALQLKESTDGRVTVRTMGPPQARAVLAEAIHMGADNGVLLSDRRFAGADVVATSYALAGGAQKVGSFDLILCGKQTTDGDTAQVGPEMAEFLSIPHACNVSEIVDTHDKSVTVRIQLDDAVQTARIALPCLLTIEKDACTPRLPSLKRKLEWSGSEDIVTYGLDDLSDSTPERYGLAGSPTQVERIFAPEASGERELFDEQSDLAGILFDALRRRKFI